MTNEFLFVSSLCRGYLAFTAFNNIFCEVELNAVTSGMKAKLATTLLMLMLMLMTLLITISHTGSEPG